MTRSTVKRLTKPLDEPEREFQRRRKAVLRSHQNESLAITGRNLFDDEASSSYNTGAKSPTPSKTLHEHSHPNSFGRTLALKDLILRFKQGDDEPIKSAWIRFQDLIKQDLTRPMNASKLTMASRYTYLGGDIYNDPSLLRFYQNDDTSPWGNIKHKEKGEDGPEWIIRSKFEEELANFMLEKKSHTKGIGDMLVQHRKELREQYSQILLTINKSETPEPEAPTFAITTRSGKSTQDPPFPAPPRPTTNNFTEGETKKEGPEGAKPSIIQEPTPRPSILYQPSKSSNLPFSSRLKKQKKDDEDERLLSIFKQIHINLPFLEAMIHMPKGAKVLKDLLLHKEKLEKAASSVKLSEECSTNIQRSLPQKEGDLGSFTLPCIIRPLAVKNALADFRANINLMPHSLLGIIVNKLKSGSYRVKSGRHS
ncbi:hypothetical protein Tco_0752812 [Tanacetum coccineum]|uniref:Uncharacterized protein n=1 Tax=Tanacetum coccineum TaxID=301880 RepID=A0ABQ4Z956_9ASTR